MGRAVGRYDLSAMAKRPLPPPRPAPPGLGITETGEKTSGSKGVSSRKTEETLDAIPGAHERALTGLEQARTKQTVSLDELR